MMNNEENTKYIYNYKKIQYKIQKEYNRTFEKKPIEIQKQ